MHKNILILKRQFIRNRIADNCILLIQVILIIFFYFLLFMELMIFEMVKSQEIK